MSGLLRSPEPSGLDFASVLSVGLRGRGVLTTRRPASGDGAVLARFSCAEEAVSYLGRLAGDEDLAVALRRFVQGAFPGVPAASLSRGEVARLVAGGLAGGRFFLVRDADRRPPVALPHGPDERPAPEQDALAAEEAPARRKTWFAVKVIDHESGKALCGVPLKVRKSDGTTVSRSTGSDGQVRLEGLDPGTCDVICDLSGNPRRPHTAEVRSVGRNAAAAQSGPTGRAAGALSASRFWLANLREHRVRTGDTLASIASQAGLTWQELARFNWGTDDPGEVNLRLRDAVGCTHTSSGGNNYEFHNDDDPGIVVVPSAWTQQGLPTGQTHVVRAQLPAWEVQLEYGNGMRPADTLVLSAEHGGYEERIKVSEAARAGDYLLFRFSVDGGGRYDIELDMGADSYFIWKGLVLPREGTGEDDTGVAWDEDGDEPDIYEGAPPAVGQALLIEELAD